MYKQKHKTSKKLRLEIKKSIYYLRQSLLGIGAAGAMSVPVQGKPLENSQASSETNYPASTQLVNNQTATYERMIEVDIDQEIEKRAQWFVDEFVKATSKHLQLIKKASAAGQKTSYVKQNFFDAVYPKGNLSGRNNYCIAAINRALKDANQYGDISLALPDYQTEGANTVECLRFVNFIAKHGFGKCIQKGYIIPKNLEVGDIVMTPRGGGRYHATTYIGNGKVRSFNNDGEGNIKKQTGIVIKTKELAQEAIRQNLEQQQLISEQKTGKQIISFQKAQMILQILYDGRRIDSHVASLLRQNTDTYHLFAETTPRNILENIKSGREI